MAQQKNTQKQRKYKKANKLEIGFAYALLAHCTEIELRLSPGQRRLFVEQAAELYTRVKNNKNRFSEYLNLFYAEAVEERFPIDRIGSYLKRRLKDGRLPKLEKENLGPALSISI